MRDNIVRLLNLSTTSMFAVIVAACGGGATEAGKGGFGPQGPAEVGAVQAQSRQVTLTHEYPAQVEAVTTVEVRPQVSGIIVSQNYRDGAAVTRGQVLFQLDARQYAVALAQAKANVAQAEVSVAKARQDIARLEPLVAADAASKQDLDNARIALQSAEATVASAQAAVRKSELDLAYTTIRAPEAGLVAKAEVRAGTLAVANQTLLTTVYSRDPMAVAVTLGEREYLAVQARARSAGATTGAGSAPAAKGAPTVGAKLFLADGSEYGQRATLDFFNAAVDPRAGTMLVRLKVPNPEGRLVAGQFARVVLSEPTTTQAVLIPQRAVQETLGQRAVMVVTDDGSVQPRPVVMGTRIGDEWVVDSGLKGGEMVMVDGFARLRPGAKVKPVDPKAPPPPGPGGPGGPPPAEKAAPAVKAAPADKGAPPPDKKG